MTAAISPSQAPDQRRIRVVGDVAYIALSKGYEAVIDVEDLDLALEHVWAARETATVIYAQADVSTAGRRASRSLHRHIMRPPAGVLVDHRDGDGLNNRRANLRLCGHAENGWNRRVSCISTSGIKGVSWIAKDQRWSARIRAGAGVRIHLGNFLTKEAAAEAYAAAAERLHGEFALFSRTDPKGCLR